MRAFFSRSKESMNRISALKNSVMAYEWGSSTFIQDLTGDSSFRGRAIAELWMGAHPLAPSRVMVDNEWKPLDLLVAQDPVSILGGSAAERFSNRIPFLFKVLAAERPLSVQVHPNMEQARQGFSRENGLGIPLEAPSRTYRDENHKPEILCALSSFQCLKGFRPIREMLDLMEQAIPPGRGNLELLRDSPDPEGLRRIFSRFMQMEPEAQRSLVKDVVVKAGERSVSSEPAFSWIVDLDREYPGDIGVLSPLFLNVLELEPGEAIHVRAGEPHSYLRGVGMELMTNSDNVLRGGLTSKHVDVEELLSIVDFVTGPPETMIPAEGEAGERMYPTPAEEFVLSVIDVDEEHPYEGPGDRGAEILIVMEGEGSITDPEREEPLPMSRGDSAVVPACVTDYRIKGKATIYKAAIPTD
jgi:mannose-6-phosphate isomerase